MSKVFPEKQSGFLRFAIVTLAGAGGAKALQCFDDNAEELDAQRFGPTNPIPQVSTDGTKQVATSILGPKGSPIVGIPSSVNLEAHFQATALALNGNAGRCTVVLTPTYDNGTVLVPSRFLTSLAVTITNKSTNAGDTVTGILYVRIQHTYPDRIPPQQNQID